jgi:hypothetical protein
MYSRQQRSIFLRCMALGTRRSRLACSASRNGPESRGPLPRMICAVSAFPVPVSPRSSTLGANRFPRVSNVAKWRISARKAAMEGACPMRCSVGWTMVMRRGRVLAFSVPWPATLMASDAVRGRQSQKWGRILESSASRCKRNCAEFQGDRLPILMPGIVLAQGRLLGLA